MQAVDVGHAAGHATCDRQRLDQCRRFGAVGNAVGLDAIVGFAAVGEAGESEAAGIASVNGEGGVPLPGVG